MKEMSFSTLIESVGTEFYTRQINERKTNRSLLTYTYMGDTQGMTYQSGGFEFQLI